MAVEIHPIPLTGNWDIGYALDQHVIKSIPLGEDAFGYQRFETTRSEIGELLYRFKYDHQRECLDEIVSTLIAFMQDHPEISNIKSIIPAPPTRLRDYQPTFKIGEALGKKLGVYCCTDVLEKESNVASKELSPDEKYKLNDSIVKKRMAQYKHNVLLIDDLFQTGATIRQCVEALREDPNIDKIFVITITKTKN